MAIFDIRKIFPFQLIPRAKALSLAAAPYITPAKIFNLLHCESEKRKRIAQPRSLPYVAILDITNICNLRCPYCPTGELRDSGRPKGMLDPMLVQKLIDEAGRYLISANLFNWGEPLLHPQIATIVGMLHRARIFTMISTNFNARGRNIPEELCNAGLDYLVVSLSGSSRETYRQYHRNGNLDVMIENTRQLIDCKRKSGRKKPLIEWKYLVFKHNIHEIEECRRLARKIGVDIFRDVRAGGDEGAVVSEGQAPERKVRVGFCHQLWHAVVINADGGISPCCYLFFKDDDLGEYSEESLINIRHNRRSVIARELFDPSAVNRLPADLRHPCLKCGLVHDQPHLGDFLALNPNAEKGHRTGGP